MNFIKEHKLFSIFLIALTIHIVAVSVIHYTNLSSYLGGTSDSIVYNKSAMEIASQFKGGNFLLKGITNLYPDIYLGHIYPAIVGVIYTITAPNIIIGELFNALLCGLISVFVYLIIIELGGQSLGAFLVGIIVSLYPSLLLNGSLLLKDALEVCLSIITLFLIIKLIKGFSFGKFALLYLLLIPIINLRFYLGYALMITFIICWSLFCRNVEFKKRIIYVILMIILMGFLPQISYGQGYWGIKSFEYYLTPKTITYYRESAYSSGQGSTLNIKTDFRHPLKFIKNYLESFIYILLGPFPWQMKYARHFLALFETVPWYFLLYFIIKGIMNIIKKRNVAAITLIVFSFIFLIVITLFDSNFGLFMRIRVPAFISLLCLAPFGFNLDKKFLQNINNY